MKNFVKIAEIGPYPPPDNGWSVRIKKLKEGLIKDGYDCVALNTGKNKKSKSREYIDIQNPLDFINKLILLRVKGYRFHLHSNAQAVKGPLICLFANIISFITGTRAILTFHGGYKQLYFPKKNAGKMYIVNTLNYFLSKKIICNDDKIKSLICDFGFYISPDKIYPIQAFTKDYLKYNKTKLPDKIERYIAGKTSVILTYIALRNGFYIDVLTDFIRECPDDIAVVVVGFHNVEDIDIVPFYDRLIDLETKGKVVLIDSLNHDQFLSAMEIADIYLRTPDSDGISASVLEALASDTIVVASENGKRPKSVITYVPNDASDLMDKIKQVVSNMGLYKSQIIKPVVPDTLKQEIEILVTP